MKNKKTKVIIFTVIILIIVAGIATFLVMKNKNSGDTGEKETYQKKPDIVIKGTEENPIKLEGFEVTNIDINKINKSCIEVKATVVNKSEVTVKGFFIEIGLFNKEKKMITEVAKNYTKEIKPNEEYILNARVVGLKNSSDIISAKILKLDKETSANMEDNFNKEINSVRPH